MLFLLRKEQRRPVSLSCLLGIVANNPEERGVGSGKRGGRGFSAQLWENKGSVSGPLGLGAAFTSAAGWWGAGGAEWRSMVMAVGSGEGGRG